MENPQYEVIRRLKNLEILLGARAAQPSAPVPQPEKYGFWDRLKILFWGVK